MQKHRPSVRQVASGTDLDDLAGSSRNPSHQVLFCIRGIFTLVCGLIALGIGSSAQAQTAYTPGGLFVHPTAFLPPAHQFSVYAAAFTQDQEMGINASYYPLSLNYTATDRLQVSALVVYHNMQDMPPHTHLGAFLKYQIAPQTASHPAFAIAGSYVGKDMQESMVSGVASQRFTLHGRLVTIAHLGIKWGRTSDDDGNRTDVGGYTGVELPINRQWNIVGEISTRMKFDRAGASSIGLMYHARSGLGISLAVVNNGRSSRMKPFIGVGFPIGH
jgi:hypothetical protein